MITYCKTDHVYIVKLGEHGKEQGRFTTFTEAIKLKWKIIDQQMLAESRK